MPGRADVQVVMAEGTPARQAVQRTIKTPRSLKCDEPAGEVRSLRATGEDDPDAVVCDAEGT